jgi:osmotically-inducible protein OsmY
VAYISLSCFKTNNDEIETGGHMARRGQGISYYDTGAMGRDAWYGRSFTGSLKRAEFGIDNREEEVMLARENAAAASSQQRQGAVARVENIGRNQNDERIRAAIQKCIEDDTSLDDAQVDVEVVFGAVTIRGGVIEPRDKEKLEELAKSVSGVTSVVTELGTEM